MALTEEQFKEDLKKFLKEHNVKMDTLIYGDEDVRICFTNDNKSIYLICEEADGDNNIIEDLYAPYK